MTEVTRSAVAVQVRRTRMSWDSVYEVCKDSRWSRHGQ